MCKADGTGNFLANHIEVYLGYNIYYAFCLREACVVMIYCHILYTY